MTETLEEFLCLLYGSRKKKVNSIQSEMFERKYINHKKVIDISEHPPCQTTLLLHSKREIVVAKIWNSSHQPMLKVLEFSLHGWNEELEIHWMDHTFQGIVTLFFLIHHWRQTRNVMALTRRQTKNNDIYPNST